MEKFNGYLYHIVRYNKWQLGDQMHFGKELNFFAQKMFQATYFVGENDVNQLLIKKSCKDLSVQEEKATKKYIYESCQIIRELVFEQVRTAKFPACPSRLKCLYCAESFEDAKSWIPALKRMHPDMPPLQIVKLKVKGKIFKGDGNLMLRNTDSINSKIQMAQIYWQGTENPILPEILFEGKAEVVGIAEEF